jgi:hypothetical protein
VSEHGESTSFQATQQQKLGFQEYIKLFEAYKKKEALEVSDGVVEDGGTSKMTTRTGATLTDANTPCALELR